MQDVLKTIGITGLALTALVYIGKLIITHIFSRDLDAHKAKLDLEIQRHAHEMNCFLKQFQIQFSKTYERQVDAVRQLYDGIRNLLGKLEMVASLIHLDEIFKTSNPPKVHDAISAAIDAHYELSKLYDDNDIYLPAALSDRIKTFLNTAKALGKTNTAFAEDFTKEMVSEWQTLWSATKPTVEQLLTELKAEFRMLQGIDTIGQQSSAGVILRAAPEK